MSDLISRKMVIEALYNHYEVNNKAQNATMDECIMLVKNIPSAEPKRGKWEDIVELDSGGYPFKVGVCCSACGFETLSEDNYCPYCGAKMVVDDD